MKAEPSKGSGDTIDTKGAAKPEDGGSDKSDLTSQENVGLFNPGEDEKGASLTSCLKKIADKYGIVVSSSSLQLGSSSSTNEYLRLQADNMGLNLSIKPLP
ncbi:ATP-binding cassette domain-containing protein, partial [Aduncisulcus paluster]